MDVSGGGGDRGGGGRGAQGGNHQVLRSPRGRRQGEVRQKLEKDRKLKGKSEQTLKSTSIGIFDPVNTYNSSSIYFHAEKGLATHKGIWQ